MSHFRKSEEVAKITGKPSEVFFAKLLPLLRKHGVSKMEDRKSWPISIMKQVLQELVQETPKHLLSNELWLRCVTGEQWWNLIQVSLVQIGNTRWSSLFFLNCIESLLNFLEICGIIKVHV